MGFPTPIYVRTPAEKETEGSAGWQSFEGRQLAGWDFFDPVSVFIEPALIYILFSKARSQKKSFRLFFDPMSGQKKSEFVPCVTSSTPSCLESVLVSRFRVWRLYGFGV